MIAQPSWKNYSWLIVTNVAYFQVDYQQYQATKTERKATIATYLQRDQACSAKFQASCRSDSTSNFLHCRVSLIVGMSQQNM